MNRTRGALLGLAVGDAVGTTNEFETRGRFVPITDMLGGGPFDLAPGEWTDDTAMALCLADSLCECKGFDAKDQMERYVRWWQDGYNSARGYCFDIGSTTRSSLQRFLETKDPFSGDPSPNAAGNGSLMRLAPVVLFFQSDVDVAVHHAGESSRTTHAAPQAIDACRYFARLLLLALHGCSKEELLRTRCGPAHAEIEEVASGAYIEKPISQIAAQGYVVKSLEAALWCFAHSDGFSVGCLMAANLGGDTDTVAAIYGQLAGAFYGEDHIPETWLARLAWYRHIRQRADDLVRVSASGMPNP